MAINVFTMALMPISQAAAWYLVAIYNGGTSSITGTSNIDQQQQLITKFFPSICSISFFYCCWALYNKYLGGNARELGQYSMGLLAIATYLQNFIGSVVATCLVLFNFFLPAYFILIKWNAEQLARNVKNDTSSLAITWAITFKLYFISNICLWSFVLYKFYMYRTILSSYTEVNNNSSWLQLPIFVTCPGNNKDRMILKDVE